MLEQLLHVFYIDIFTGLRLILLVEDLLQVQLLFLGLGGVWLLLRLGRLHVEVGVHVYFLFMNTLFLNVADSIIAKYLSAFEVALSRNLAGTEIRGQVEGLEGVRDHRRFVYYVFLHFYLRKRFLAIGCFHLTFNRLRLGLYFVDFICELFSFGLGFYATQQRLRPTHFAVTTAFLAAAEANQLLGRRGGGPAFYRGGLEALLETALGWTVLR
jgi:hypothetical protein